MDQSQNQNQSDHVKPADDLPSTPPPPAADAAPPLTPTAWLMNNAIYLVVIGAIIGVIWYNLGLEGVWYVAKVVIGLGFVIFVHELGHFLAAKWCDVHVQTFSIGFGPALPGCSYQRGETTYKIGVLPLGGYVNMIGEGLEADEDEEYPRSFKNKTVGQRMLIISAGVIMNVLLGAVLFIVVYYYHGVLAPPAVVGKVDAGSPMWVKGIPTGSRIVSLGGIQNPTFDTLRRKVILSGKDEKIPFTFVSYGPNGEPQGERTVELLPRREANDPNPIVGVLPPYQLRLYPRPKKDSASLAVVRNSAAAAARPIALESNEVIVATTDPENPARFKTLKHSLKAGTFDYLELGKRLRALIGQKMVLQILTQGAAEKDKPAEREVSAEGFQFNDTIVGCTEAQDARAGSYNPFRVRELPRDPRRDSGDRRDPFVFHDRLRRLAGLPMVVQVRRGDPDDTSFRDNSATGPVVNLFVPAAFHVTFGLRMKMGKIAGVREDSPAAKADVQKGDELTKVVLLDEHDKPIHTWEEFDPVRLPFELAQKAQEHAGTKRVILTVRRQPSENEHMPRIIDLKPVDWEDRWDNDEETALNTASPLPIPQLGLAYWVLSQIVEVEPGKPSATAELKKDDTLKEFRIKEESEFSAEPKWSNWTPLETERDGATVLDGWAPAFEIVQLNSYKEVQFKVNRLGVELKEPVTLTAVEDPTWPLVARGFIFQRDSLLLKADTLAEAIVMGTRESKDMVILMFLQLRRLVERRVSFKQVGGPIAMVSQGFFVARSGNFELLLFLGIISINLAVVNFLPIPILDGGHMVFLLYEKLRGRPPAETVRAVATYIGLATIALLMVLVFYQDIRKLLGI